MSPAMELVTDENAPRVIMRTSLYDLIEALNDVVEPGEEFLVVPLVMDLLESGRITFLGRMEHCN